MDLSSIISLIDSFYNFIFKVVGCEPAFILAVLLAVTLVSRIVHVREKYQKDKNLILGSLSFIFSFACIYISSLGKENIIMGDIFSQTLRLGAVTSFSYQILKSYSKLFLRIVLKSLAERAGVQLTTSEMKGLEEDSSPSEVKQQDLENQNDDGKI